MYKTGALKNKIDTRDIQLAQVQAPVEIPKKHITDISMIPVLDQKNIGACVGHAIATNLAYLNYKETGSFTFLSPRFIYALSKQMDNNPAQGTYPRIAAKVVTAQGCAPNYLCINDTSLPYYSYITIQQNTSMMQQAFIYKTAGYAFVGSDKESLKQAIYKNGVICASLHMDTATKRKIKPGRLTLHHVLLYGYEDKRNNTTFYYRNSWGQSWGDKGNGKFVFKDFEGKIYDAIAFVDLPNFINKKNQSMPQSQEFQKAITQVLKWEGGYVNDPNDPGGETKYGISKSSYPSLDIKNLTEDAAEQIYYKDYWLAASCDKMPYSVALNVFDTAVNMGIKTACMMLQDALGVKADGNIGNITLSALQGINNQDLVEKFNVLRIQKYASLSLWKTYGKGWITRTLDTYTVSMIQ